MDQKRLSLQPRLRRLAELVPAGCRLTDVGTDHGYLPVSLLQQGRIASAIASDIGAEPLEHARRTAAACKVEGLSFRLCPGLAAIAPEETDVIVIAGMGGETILAILQAAPWTKDGRHCLLLQPMTKTADLRRWLVDNGYTFTGEYLVEDKGRIYPILCVCGGVHRPLTQAEALCGVLLDGDPLYGAYLDEHIARLRRSAAGLRQSSDPALAAQAVEGEALAAELEEKRRLL